MIEKQDSLANLGNQVGTSEELILIVDDVEENLFLLRRILTKAGYQVETMTDSTAVLQVCKNILPALILLDIQMPGIDGFEVCKQILRDPVTSAIPVIFISALESTAARLRGFEAGAVDYIIKPIEIEETLARVRSHLTICKLQKKLKVLNIELDQHVADLTLSQEQLRGRENKLTAFINALPNITFVHDEEGKYLEINSNDIDHMVASIEDMLGKKISDFLPPDIAKMKLAAIQSVIKTGQTRVIEYQLPVQNGIPLWFEGRIALMERESPSKGKVICVTAEITERMELYQKVQALAIQDPLTNCFNRRHFLELARREITRACRFNRPLSLMIIDIDHFKQVNDQYGHPFGDQVLCQLVDVCQQTLRSTDILGRYGGEEFVILFSETGMLGAIEVAERIRHNVEKTDFFNKTESIRITISGGLACLEAMRETKVTLETFIEEADKALYKAKENGRNRVHTNCRLDPENLLKSDKQLINSRQPSQDAS